MNPGWFGGIYDDCLPHSSSLTQTMKSCLLLPGAEQSTSTKTLLHYLFFFFFSVNLSCVALWQKVVPGQPELFPEKLPWCLWQLSEVNGLDDWTLVGERKVHRGRVELDLWFTIKIKFDWCPNTFNKSKEEKMAANWDLCSFFKYVRVWESLLSDWCLCLLFLLTPSSPSTCHQLSKALFVLWPPTKINSLLREKHLCKHTLQLVTFLKLFINGKMKKQAERYEWYASCAEPISILSWERQGITLCQRHCKRWMSQLESW